MRYLPGLLFACLFVLLSPVWVGAQAPLALRVGEQDVDLAGRAITFRLSGGRVQSAELQLLSPEDELLYSGRQSYERSQLGAAERIGWPELGSRGENFRAELKVTAADGRWVTFEIVRFYTEIPHEEVEFDSGSADVTQAEQGKLEKPLALLREAVTKYAKLMDVRLYIAGHTDTVGQAANNHRLSERRAQAIATHLIQRGSLTGMPVFVRGCGESAPLVETGDNVDERRNRRAQYIISSFEPALPCPGGWRRVH